MLHRHKWHEISREYGHTDVFGHFILNSTFSGVEGAVTLITYACSVLGCNKLKQEMLKGHLGDSAIKKDNPKPASKANTQQELEASVGRLTILGIKRLFKALRF